MQETVQTIQETVQLIVYAIGGVITLVGAIDALSGYSNQSSGKMSEGIIKAVGGAGIVLIGNKLIPAIFNSFTAAGTIISFYNFLF